MPVVERKLPLTSEQVELLNAAEQATQQAIQRTNLVLATIMAGAGIRGATVKGMEPGDPPVLVVLLPGPALVPESAPGAAEPHG